MPEEVVPAGKVTVSAPDPEMAGMDKAFVGTRLNVPKPGQPTQQDREKMAIGLLDTLAGALRGAAAQVGGLPGDIRSILDMINQEGAEKYLGQRSFATTEEILKDTSVRVPGTQIDVPFPPVLKEGVPNRAERQKAVEVAQEVGTFLPAPGIPEAAIQGVKAVGKAIKATKNMPVGMSTQAVGQGMDELGFYSAAKQAVDAIQQPKGTGAQFLAQISKTPGVKPDEIKWTGLDEFLAGKKSVTKAEVQEYLDKNRVQIKEVTLGSGPNPYPYRTADEWQGAIDRAERARDFDESERLTNAWEAFEGLGMDDQTKFSKYTLPGGENYREILLTLPSKNKFDPAKVDIVRNRQSISQGTYTIKYDNKEVATFFDQFNVADNYKGLSDEEIMGVAKQMYEIGSEYSGIKPVSGGFKSQHFDQPNILAHLRVNDRVIDGKKTLFVEEVQSDWHQAGRKKGYQGTAEKDYDNYIKDLTNRYQDEILKYSVEQGMAEDKAKVLAKKLTNQKSQDPRALADYFGESEKQMAMNKARVDERSLVPDAPFKTTWSDLSMKRVIQMASEGGYDRIAFTTGKTQAERFDLSKQVKDISYMRNEDGTYGVTAFSLEDIPLIEKASIKESDLADYVGKDVAEKIISGKGKIIDKTDPMKVRSLTGVDLSVGGEGMKGFYDDILPKFLDKYAKKWDAKTGTTNMRIATDAQDAQDSALLRDLGMPEGGKASVQVNYIDVTPKMRESVVTKGQPMFAIGAGGAGAAATQEENE
jgi:hypothetical protein